MLQGLSLIAASFLGNGFHIRTNTLNNGFNVFNFKAKSRIKKRTLKRKKRMSAKQKLRFKKRRI